MTALFRADGEGAIPVGCVLVFGVKGRGLYVALQRGDSHGCVSDVYSDW